MDVRIFRPVICKTPHKNIIIYDERGVLFYNSEWAKKFTGIFSLPIGVYSSNVEFKVLRPLKRKKLKLLRIERNKGHEWSKFKIEFYENPHKCTIYHKRKLIVFDNKFKTAPKFQLMFVLLHEKGHNYYKSEEKADWYAIRGMWIRGFNKSQIGLAPLITLSEKNLKRKQIVINFLINKLK